MQEKLNAVLALLALIESFFQFQFNRPSAPPANPVSGL